MFTKNRYELCSPINNHYYLVLKSVIFVTKSKAYFMTSMLKYEKPKTLTLYFLIEETFLKGKNEKLSIVFKN